uniref:arginine--tRNA ligase n=1 Tax=Gongylonema pulchrum TaxID=637853 RepID=A0A183DJA2_9BILA
LCDYVYELATTFHDFYNECYVIQKDMDGAVTLHYQRLVLCQVTADVMANCFKILGLRTVEKM